MVPDLELRRRDVRPDRDLVRQPGLRRGGDPRLPARLRPGRRRPGLRDAGATAGRPAPRPRPGRSPGPRPGPPQTPLHGPLDPLKPGGTADLAGLFTPRHQHGVIEAGHNLPQEAPAAFADAVLTVRGWLT